MSWIPDRDVRDRAADRDCAIDLLQDKIDHARFDDYLLELMLVHGMREGHGLAEVLHHPALRSSYHHSTVWYLMDYDTERYGTPEIVVDGQNVPRVDYGPDLWEDIHRTP